jgi:uncharacterized repeat protein (TIGR04042 family)
MPELCFTLHLPDGTPMVCRSPSTIIRSHLPPGTHDIPDFLAQARRGFAAASDRVRAVHGHPCSQAAAQLHAIETACRSFERLPSLQVIIDPY